MSMSALMPNTDPEQPGLQRDPVHVVAGVIYNIEGDQVLIARRPQNVHQGGLWEFPGGKVDVRNDENPRQALCRELQEELALTVVHCEPLLEVHHDYTDKSVVLEVWKVLKFTGVPAGNEGQTIAWVSLSCLDQYPFPAANQAILAAIAQ